MQRELQTLDEPVIDTIVRERRWVAHPARNGGEPPSPRRHGAEARLEERRDQAPIRAHSAGGGRGGNAQGTPQLCVHRGEASAVSPVRLTLAPPSPAGDLWGPLMLCVLLSMCVRPAIGPHRRCAARPSFDLPCARCARPGQHVEFHGAGGPVLARFCRRVRHRVVWGCCRHSQRAAPRRITVSGPARRAAAAPPRHPSLLARQIVFPKHLRARLLHFPPLPRVHCMPRLGQRHLSPHRCLRRLRVGDPRSVPRAPCPRRQLTRAATASVVFMAQMVPTERKVLAVFPVFLFYVVISWMIVLE